MARSFFRSIWPGKKSGTPLCNGRYRVIDQVGEGGMGKVYRGETRSGKVVAVKEVLQKSLAPQDVASAVAAMRHEASILGALRHPRIPRLVDAFQDGGRCYLVMEYVDGMTLSQYRKAQQGNVIPLKDVLNVGRQLCEILTYLHNCAPAVLFLDLKPSNVMRTSSGSVYLVDFGIARQVGIVHDLFRQTVVCTPRYASPEQQRSIYETTERSDIYSLGAALFDLTGRSGSPLLMSLLARMRDPQAHLRPSLKEVSNALSDDLLASPFAISSASSPSLRADEPTVIPTLRRNG